MIKYKNNPFCLRHTRLYRRPGESCPRDGRSTFVSEYYGIRAAANIIFYSLRSFGKCTIQEIIYYFSPIPTLSKENYIHEVCRITKIPPLKVLSTKNDYALVMKAIAQVNEYPLFLEQILDVLDDLDIEKALKAGCN